MWGKKKSDDRAVEALATVVERQAELIRHLVMPNDKTPEILAAIVPALPMLIDTLRSFRQPTRESFPPTPSGPRSLEVRADYDADLASIEAEAIAARSQLVSRYAERFAEAANDDRRAAQLERSGVVHSEMGR
jgi:hypothetical protein